MPDATHATKILPAGSRTTGRCAHMGLWEADVATLRVSDECGSAPFQENISLTSALALAYFMKVVVFVTGSRRCKDVPDIVEL